MTHKTRISFRAAQLAAPVFSGTLAICLLGSNPAAGSENSNISYAAPDGFADLSIEQIGVVDVYYGGKLLGDARVRISPGSVVFDEPHNIVAMLPALNINSVAQRQMWDAAFKTHSDLACGRISDDNSCGRMVTNSIALIFDKNRQKIDFFIAEKLLATPYEAEPKYLTEPTPGVSVVNSISGLVSGSMDSDPAFSIQNRFLLADRGRRFRADFIYSDRIGAELEEAVLEIDRPGYRYSAGTFWVDGSNIYGRAKILGAGLQTQLDTRSDRELAYGTPIIVYLDQQSRVSIIRDGRLISSRLYDAGSQHLETSGLADGSYEVVLQIAPVSGSVREERRFFSKDRSIPTMGELSLSVFGGVLMNKRRSNGLTVTDTPFAQASIGIRESKSIALEATALATNGIGIAETGAYLLSKAATVKMSAMTATDGSYGAMLQINSAGNSDFNYNFDLRHIQAASPQALNSGLDIIRPTFLTANSTFTSGTISQASGTVSFNLHNAQLLGAASYRQNENGQINYSIGPSVRWDFYQDAKLRLTLNGDMVFTDRGESAFLGMSLQVLGGRTSLSSSAGIRRSSFDVKDTNSVAVGSLYGSWHNNSTADQDIRFSAGVSRELNQSSASVATDIRTSNFHVTGDLSHGTFSGQRSTQYGAGFATTISANGRSLEFDGRATSDSIVIVRLNGAKSTDVFDVILDGMEVGKVYSDQSFTLALPTYNKYSVRIRPSEGGLVYYDGTSREFSVYPGSVVSLDWDIKPIKVIFGRLVSHSGAPFANASLTAEGGISQTDDHGYFQIEATIGSVLNVVLPDGIAYEAKMPASLGGSQFQKIGNITCCSIVNRSLFALSGQE